MVKKPLIKPQSGFTLTELLVVMAIIAFIMAILFPVIDKATNRAHAAKTRNNLRQIKAAIEAYYNEYQRLPRGSGWGEKLGETEVVELLGALSGKSSADVSNPKQYIFYTVVETNDMHIDPWDNAIRIYMDHDYDGEITTFTEYKSGSIDASVVVASEGVGGRARLENDPSQWITTID